MFKFNSKKIKTNKRGFTLIELILYMGLFSILTLLIAQVFGVVFEAQIENDANVSVSTDAKYIMNRFSYDMNRASSITIPSTPGATSSSMTVVVNSQNLRYSLDNGKLILSNLTTGTSDQLNSSDASISAVAFRRLDGGGKDVVEFYFLLNSIAVKRSGRESRGYTTSAGLR